MKAVRHFIQTLALVCIIGACSRSARMDTQVFWKLMETSKAQSGGDPTRQLDIIKAGLMEYTPEQVYNFACIQRDLVAGLMCRPVELAYFAIEANYLDSTTLYAGDDRYWGFLHWLIAQGEQVYTRMLTEPDYLAEVINAELSTNMEPAGSIADEVYHLLTGNEMPALPQAELPERDFELDEAALRPEIVQEGGEYHREVLRECPKLWKMFH